MPTHTSDVYELQVEEILADLGITPGEIASYPHARDAPRSRGDRLGVEERVAIRQESEKSS